MAFQKSTMEVIGKIFCCLQCARKIQVKYEGVAHTTQLMPHQVQKQLEYSRSFQQPNRDAPELGFYLYDLGWCVVCYERYVAAGEKNRSKNAANAYEELQNNRGRVVEQVKSLAAAVLKQVVSSLTLDDVQRAIGQPVDCTFGDKHATDCKRHRLIKVFVQKYSVEIDRMIRTKVFAEGSIIRIVRQYRKDVLPQTRKLKLLMSSVYFPKKTNAAEQLNDFCFVEESFRRPANTSPEELFFGEHGMNIDEIMFSLALSTDDVEFGLSMMISRKLFHEVIKRLTENSHSLEDRLRMILC